MSCDKWKCPAAETLHRRWIGIDIAYLAINLVELRLKKAFRDIVYRLEGQPRSNFSKLTDSLKELLYFKVPLGS